MKLTSAAPAPRHPIARPTRLRQTNGNRLFSAAHYLAGPPALELAALHLTDCAPDLSATGGAVSACQSIDLRLQVGFAAC